MQFFMDGNGVIQASYPYNINQGGQDAYEINLYAPFAAGTVITASFKLPNGEIKSGYQLTEIGAVNDVKIAGSPARLWKMTIPGEITQYYGTVTAQFFVSTSTGTLPSSSTSFIVARGVPQVIDDTSPLDTITENIASLQTDLNNGYFSARALREWSALYTYGLGELVYVSEDDGNVLLESLKADNTDPPYVDGQLNTASWKVVLDKFVTPLSDTAPIMDGTASAGSTPEAARGDHVHPTDTTRAAAADLTNEISARQAADTALQQAVALKQDSTDNNLSTTAKTIVGAINENKVSIDDLEDGTTPAGRVGNTLTVVVGDTTTTYDGSTSQTVNVPVAGIQGTLSATINGTAKTYNGSADVALGSIYAPTTAGTVGKIPVWDDNGTIVWQDKYEVGAVYISFENTSPAAIYGGDWNAIYNTFLYATTSGGTSGGTGGEATHTLTIDEMPSHGHELNIGWGSGDGTATGKVSESNGGAGYWLAKQTGSSQPHNNLPPYTRVYMWQRIA